jgi:hypothetical protein
MFDASEVRALLIEAARAGTSLTYSQALRHLGHAFSRPKMRALCKVLDAIDEDARVAGEPELAVLVVRQSDGLPGQGWFVGRSAADLDLPRKWEGVKAKAYIAKAHNTVFAYWQKR